MVSIFFDKRKLTCVHVCIPILTIESETLINYVQKKVGDIYEINSLSIFAAFYYK